MVNLFQFRQYVFKARRKNNKYILRVFVPRRQIILIRPVRLPAPGRKGRLVRS
jgi:hypothetical protein